jgi:hypothetical protein
MQSNYPETKFDRQPEGQNSFIHGSHADKKTHLRASNHCKCKLLCSVGHDLYSARFKILAIAIMLDCCLKQDARKQKADTSCEAGSGFAQLLRENFIQGHGGQLTRESALGEVCTFSFTISELLG